MIKSITNPYTSMLLTYSPDRFYGRDNEVISILQLITAPEPGGHAINGMRTTGKSTLLKYIKDPNGALLHFQSYVHPEFRQGGTREILFVYINFHNFQEDESVFVYMLRHLVESIEDANLYDRISVPLVEDEIRIPEAVNCIKDILNELDDNRIRAVFLLDDFDPALAYIDADDDRMLRSISDQTPLIIVTELPITELRPDIGADSPLLGILRPDALRLIPEQGARQIIEEPAKAVKQKYTESEIEFLIEVAGLQPVFLIAASELYFDMRVDYPKIAGRLTTPESREQFKQQFIFRLSREPYIDNMLNIVWNKLNRQERDLLIYLAQHRTVEMMSPRGGIAEKLSKKALTRLDMTDGTYHLFSELFADFVRRTTATDHMTENIKPIDSKLEEKLTPIDKALLKYLIDRPNTICTFDELLDAIWEDSDKSKRALEAAVYRLRNSLENGQRIKNVRGKGYKYVVEERVNTA